jgi:predicted AlkP superfamily phosphohydrolase/phosphomutase
MRKPRTILMIGLDAADLLLVEKWIADGSLPNLEALKKSGTYCQLATPAKYLAGSPWPTFYTGLPPSYHGIYHDFQWCQEHMAYQAPNSQWIPAEPWWRQIHENTTVVAYDVPMTLSCTAFRGVEVTGWASHDKLASPASHPSDLLFTIRKRFGEWQVPPEDFGRSSIHDLLKLRQTLIDNTRKSTQLALWLLQHPWDLGIVVLSALHRGAHRLWDRTSIDGHIGELEGSNFDCALRDLYMACDHSIGQLIEAHPDATIFVFSLHGMMANTSRVDFMDGMLARILTKEHPNSSHQGLLRRLGEKLPLDLRRLLTRSVPNRLKNRLMTLWATGGILWSQTPAFSLRADLQGYIRFNKEGREPEGIIPAGKTYEELYEQISEGLLSFRDDTTGETIIKAIHNTDQLYPDGPRRDRLPDMIILWNETSAAKHRGLVSQRYGRIHRSTPGRIPNGRSGNHRGEGFLIASGPGIAQNTELIEKADIIDIAPTVLKALGVSCKSPLAGRPIPEIILSP